jgi:hypothetical protein
MQCEFSESSADNSRALQLVALLAGIPGSIFAGLSGAGVALVNISHFAGRSNSTELSLHFVAYTTSRSGSAGLIKVTFS